MSGKKLLSLAVTLLAVITLSAQKRSSEEYVLWDARRTLNWDDFNTFERVSERSALVSIETGLFTEGYTRKYGRLRVLAPRVYSYFEKTTSWVAPDGRTSQMLEYAQLLFDQTEVIARKMQLSLDEHADAPDWNDTLTFYRKEAKRISLLIEDETENGRNYSKVCEWRKKIDEQLLAMPSDPIIPPQWSPTNLSFDGFMGLGMMIPFKTLPPIYGFMAGIGVYYRKIGAFFEMGVGSSTALSHDLKTDEGQWRIGDRFSSFQVSANITYRMLDNSYLTIAPFVGVGFSALGMDASEEEDVIIVSDGEKGLNYQFGVSTSLKAIRSLNLINREYSDYGVRFLVYLSKNQFDYARQRWFLNIGIALNATSGWVK